MESLTKRKKTSRVDVLDLMAFYNIEVIIRGEEAQFKCQFHNDKDPSSSINIITGNWTCYRCKIGGSPIELVSRLEGWEFKKADLWLRNRYGGFFKPASLLGEVSRYLKNIEIEPYQESVLDNFKHYTDYWDGRGISREYQEKFELGFDPKTKRATIPIRSVSRKLVGVQGRATTKEGEEYGKYLFLYDLPKKRYVYGLHLMDTIDKVVVVEGIVSAIRLNSMGIPTVSTLGSVISDEQAEQLNGFSSVYMLFDNDEAGWFGMIGPNPKDKPHSKIAAWKKLKTRVYIPTSEDYDDLDLLLKEEIEDLLESSKNAHVWVPLMMSEKFSA